MYLVGEMQKICPCYSRMAMAGRLSCLVHFYLMTRLRSLVLYSIWLVQAKDDPWYQKMQQGQTPEWTLRSKAILFTDVDGKDAVVSTGSGRVSRCMDLWMSSSMGPRIVAEGERRETDMEGIAQGLFSSSLE